MNHYLNISQKYLFVHKRKTRLTILSVIIAVALVVGIFSMLDALVKYERTQILESEGNYHILIRNPSRQEIDFVTSRIEIQNSGMLVDLGQGVIDDEECALGSIDANFAANLNVELSEGRSPIDTNEIMLEKWYLEKRALELGDTVTLQLPNDASGEYVICGIIKDWGATKAAAIPFAFLSPVASGNLTPVSGQYFILFKEGVNIQNVKHEIASAMSIPEGRMGNNEGLLALMFQTANNRVLKFYTIGTVLFTLVLITAVIMIYNTFNISVMDRVRQFGMLRCIGASQKQIKRLVGRESCIISLKAIPLGVLTGMIMTVICLSILKFYNRSLFGNISIFFVSLVGIGAGVLIGFLSVFAASLLPAKRAAKISPIHAVTGSRDCEILNRTRHGFLTKLFKVETAIGIHHAFSRKRTFILMSSSVALSIILFLAFHVLVNPVFIGSNPTKLYTADLSITSETGINESLFYQLSDLDGIKNVFGKRSTYASTLFPPSSLTKESVNSLLLSYDQKQLKLVKDDISKGVSDENKLNEQNGIIAVNCVLKNNDIVRTADFQLGDKVSLKTDSGNEEFTVMGILDSAPYSSDTLVTFITTETLFSKLSDSTLYQAIDIQLEGNNQDRTVDRINGLIDSTITLHDKRQLNREANSTFMTIAIFVYGFVGVIGLISLLNIINTMNTSILSRTKYLGIMRAVGMSGKQLHKMILVEAGAYSLTGCIMGCTAGLILQKALIDDLLSDPRVVWSFPAAQIGFVFLLILFITGISVISPLKKIKEQGISEVIESL
ncbi:MAG: FtsX-like permease family protein [Lachnospiraceae bacterium]